MIPVVLSIVGLLALAAWGLALVSMLQVVGMVPKGQKLSALFDFGWWRFDRLREVAGNAAAPWLRRYMLGVVGFFIAVVLIAVSSVLLATQQQSGATAALLISPDLPAAVLES